jgi:hypothetical protein
VPWCDDCERFSNPNTLAKDGGCPSCGTIIAAPRRPDELDDAETGLKSVPWHFWLLLIALVVYLGWRLVQGVGWLVGRF